jgi:MFS family permease
MRRVVAPNTRMAPLALLVVLTTGGLAARAPDPEPGMAGAVPLAVLLGLSLVALVLGMIAAPRHRLPRPPGRRWPALVITLLLGAAVAGVAIMDASLVVAAAFLAILLAAAAVARLRELRAAEKPSPGKEISLVAAVRRALSALTEPAPDPSTAIIHCYATLESALSTVPHAAPRAADSPTEVMQRAAIAGALHSPGAWRLVELFDEARFSRHWMTTKDRKDAEAALRSILHELEASRLERL